MEFEWNETKYRANLEKHGIDFLRAVRIFDGPRVTQEDKRRDYGEKRFVSIGFIDDECYLVVFTRRGELVRIISAWKGGRRDKERYYAYFAGSDPGDERTR